MPIQWWARDATTKDLELSRLKIRFYLVVLFVCVFIFYLTRKSVLIMPLAGISAAMILDSLGVLIFKKVELAHPKLSASDNKLAYIIPKGPLMCLAWIGLVFFFLLDMVRLFAALV